MNNQLNESWKLLHDVEAGIVARIGNGISGRIRFEAISSKMLEEETLAKIQMELGYHPAGYGFFSIGKITITTTDKITKYTYFWQCSASCD